MQNKMLLYGNIKSKLNGEGVVTFENEKKSNVIYSLIQYENGKVLFFATLQDISPIDLLIFNLSMPQIKNFKGFDKKRRPINIENFGFTIRSFQEKGGNGYTFIAQVNMIDILYSTPAKNSYLTFDIVNCEFGKVENSSSNESRFGNSSKIEFFIDSKKVSIYHLDDYSSKIERLHATSNIELTSQLQISVDEKTGLHEAILIADKICFLLSIANSTLVNWISYEIFSENNEMVGFGYRNSITRGFYSSSLLDNSDVLNFQKFITKGLDMFSRVDEIYNIQRITRAYSETHFGPFLETRTMLIASIVESLTLKNENKNGREFIIDDKLFDGTWKSVKRSVKVALQEGFPELKKEGRVNDILMEIERTLNRYPFRKKIENLVKDLDVDIPKSEIEEFVKIRNSLMHSGKFPEEGKRVESYKLMQHILDRIILRLFDYRGLYLDISIQSYQKL